VWPLKEREGARLMGCCGGKDFGMLGAITPFGGNLVSIFGVCATATPEITRKTTIENDNRI
jgi:hypothetical protein